MAGHVPRDRCSLRYQAFVYLGSERARVRTGSKCIAVISRLSSPHCGGRAPCGTCIVQTDFSGCPAGRIIIKKMKSMIRLHVIIMTEKPGHFEQGRWVLDSEPPAPQPAADAIDKRLSDATRAVISSVDNVMTVTRDLVTTDEGKQFIDKTIQDTQVQIRQTFEDMVSRIRAELDKKIKR